MKEKPKEVSYFDLGNNKIVATLNPGDKITNVPPGVKGIGALNAGYTLVNSRNIMVIACIHGGISRGTVYLTPIEASICGQVALNMSCGSGASR